MFNLFGQDKNPRKLAEKARQENDPHKAVNLYSDAIKYEKEGKSPNRAFLSELYLLRGEIYLNQGVAILSSSDFLHAIEYNPQNGVAHNDLGIWFTLAQFTTPDYSRALEHAEKAVEYCPERQDFRMNLAVIKIKNGQKETGRMELEELYKNGYGNAKIAMERFCE
ncbi:MAG: hypothetical protein JST26_13255 [Bacteroidetes bacterium]|nr:hypothetical protein [Bacteroidota bacterium]